MPSKTLTDLERLEEQVSNLLTSTKNDKILFNLNDIYARSKPQASSIRAQIDDILSTSRFVEQHGLWVIAEVEGPVYVAIELFGPGLAEPSMEQALHLQVEIGNIALYTTEVFAQVGKVSKLC